MFDQKEFLEKIKSKGLQHDPQASVILFGSRARGDHRPDSDWDVLVLIRKEATSALRDGIRDAISDVELEFLQPISTIIRNKAESEVEQFRTIILQELSTF